MTGANLGEWFDGSSFTRPARSASAYFRGSVPPTSQYTEGTSQARARTVKSSLAEARPACSTRSPPKRPFRASVTLCVAPSSFTVRGNAFSVVNVGGFGAPDVVASPLAMRR